MSDENPYCMKCGKHLGADDRDAEQAQREALARLLLDSGDITPAGARLLTQPRNGGAPK